MPATRHVLANRSAVDGARRASPGKHVASHKIPTDVFVSACVEPRCNAFVSLLCNLGIRNSPCAPRHQELEFASESQFQTIDNPKGKDSTLALMLSRLPQGPSAQYLRGAQYFRTLVPKPINGIVFGTRNHQNWGLGPSGTVERPKGQHRTSPLLGASHS